MQRLVLASLVFGLSAIACGSSREPVETSRAQPMAPYQAFRYQTMAGMCPTAIPGTTVSVLETGRGVAMSFITPGDIAELQRRVQHMAAMYDHRFGGMSGRHGQMPPAPPVGARVEPTAQGALLVLVPVKPSHMEALRAHVLAHASHLRRGRCPTMADVSL